MFLGKRMGISLKNPILTYQILNSGDYKKLSPVVKSNLGQNGLYCLPAAFLLRQKINRNFNNSKFHLPVMQLKYTP
jgi:hypothetical protein